jgi:DNA-directed RNA polymerase specialized sigma24 family protein
MSAYENRVLQAAYGEHWKAARQECRRYARDALQIEENIAVVALAAWRAGKPMKSGAYARTVARNALRAERLKDGNAWKFGRDVSGKRAWQRQTDVQLIGDYGDSDFEPTTPLNDPAVRLPPVPAGEYDEAATERNRMVLDELKRRAHLSDVQFQMFELHEAAKWSYRMIGDEYQISSREAKRFCDEATKRLRAAAKVTPIRFKESSPYAPPAANEDYRGRAPAPKFNCLDEGDYAA